MFQYKTLNLNFRNTQLNCKLKSGIKNGAK